MSFLKFNYKSLKKKFNISFTALILIVFLCLLPGCIASDEMWTPFKWKIDSIENPENISAKIKKSTVEVRVSGEGSIVLKCKNCRPVIISVYKDDNSGYHDFDVVDDAQLDIKESDNLKVIVEDNFVKIVFKQVPDDVKSTKIGCSSVNAGGEIIINYVK